MPQVPEDGQIDKLESSLNSRAHIHAYRDVRQTMAEPEIPRTSSWQGNVSGQDHDQTLQDLIKMRNEREEHRERALFKKILYGAIGFFVIALGISAWLYFGGSSTVSSSNIDIQVAGPTSVPGGSELSLDVDIQNKNNTDLQNATLTVEYPAGTKVAGDLTTELTRQNIAIGSIPSHGDLHKTLNAVLFGEKSSIQTIKITLAYAINGSSATFNKEKDYDISLASSPLIVTAQYPTTVKSNDPFDIVLTATSNSADVLHNVLLTAQYPFGYTFESGSPTPISGNATYQLGDMSSGDSKTITIHGVLAGENNDERTFLFGIGIGKTPTATSIDTALGSLSEAITLQKPSIGLTLSLNNDTSEPYVSHAGDNIDVTVNWQNNTPNKLLNSTIVATLTGNTLNRSSVSALSGGFYRSSNNTITWDKTSNPDLASVDPGKSGMVEFRFSPSSNIASGSTNQDIGLSLNFSGSQVVANQSPQTVSAVATRTVKLGSELGFSGRVSRSQGPFENTGPIPPKADKPTTYTVLWTLTDSLNDVTGATVSATLPSYVSWNNLALPKSENISFDQSSNTVTWNAGNIANGTGSSKPARTVAFQITFTPSLGQVGTIPTLVNPTTVTATDAFTNASLTLSRVELTTLTNDPDAKGGDEQVVP